MKVEITVAPCINPMDPLPASGSCPGARGTGIRGICTSRLNLESARPSPGSAGILFSCVRMVTVVLEPTAVQIRYRNGCSVVGSAYLRYIGTTGPVQRWHQMGHQSRGDSIRGPREDRCLIRGLFWRFLPSSGPLLSH